MSGRHRKLPASSRSAARLAVTGAVISGTGFALTGNASAASDTEWDQVARCESSGNWSIDTGNGFQGGLQFLPSTWISYGGGQFAASANLATRDQQIAIAERVLAGQGRGAWPVCGHRLSRATPRNVIQEAKNGSVAAPKNTPAAPVDDALPAATPPIDDALPAATPPVDDALPVTAAPVDDALPAATPPIDDALPAATPPVDDVAPFDFQAWLASLFPRPQAPEPEFGVPVSAPPDEGAVDEVPVPPDSPVSQPGTDGAQAAGVLAAEDHPAYDTAASSPIADGIAIPSDGTPHLPSTEILPPGTGATTAAIHTVATTHKSPATTADTVLAAGSTASDGANSSSDGRQVIAVTEPTADVALHSEELAKGAAFAQERADREARLQRPQFVMPTNGVFTSGFGYRWGALHGGIDLANAIGTPIYAAADGVVIDAGPTAGFGAWVKVRHNDGTVTLYGHVNTWLVGVGDRVLAGDQIATIGNRGNSTGPHLHFEVLLNGTDRIDPVGWLAQRGLSPGAYAG
jgi:murein DD-endopeptidase MepM/ murein hydrolase activator NlpD